MPDEAALLDPQPVSITLSTGLEVSLQPMRTRQLMRLMRIVTHGAGAAMLASSLDLGADPEEFVSKLSAIVLLAIPDAESETIEFLASMVEPVGLIKPQGQQRRISEEDRKANQERYDQLNDALFNPDLCDTIDLIEAIITSIAPDLKALGERMRRLMESLKKLGPEKLGLGGPAQSPTPQQLSENLSAPSPPPSTPSAASTDGATSEFSTSPSEDSASAAPPSVNAGEFATQDAAV